MRYLKIILIISCTCTFAKAQLINDSKRVADVYFANKEYYAAAEYYKKALMLGTDSSGFVVPYGFENKIKEESPKKEDYEYAVFQLANSLRLYKNFQNAEKWYAIATNFTNPKYELSGFWYGECLRSNLRFEEAIVAYDTFIANHKTNDSYQERAKNEIASCRFALAEIKYPRRFKLTKLAPEINLAGSNYATAVSGQTFYFTSSRPVATNGKDEVLWGKTSADRVVKKATPYLNAIYTSANDPSASQIEVSKIAVQLKQMEAAAPTIHPSGSYMYFTAWLSKGDKTRSIYISKKTADGGWSEPSVLGGEINVTGFNSMQPSITKDGKYLIFSSDRPGGSGKYDLWYAMLRADGTTGNAMNLGNEINTKGDEEAPYYNPKTSKLLYSTNGKTGMGGFDFYETQGDFSNWSTPRNMGYPFNSAKDDVYFTPLDDLDQQGYISSDRESLCCLEIFHLKREILMVNGKLIDCNTLQPLAGAKVTITGEDIPPQSVISNEDGTYSFGITSNRGLQLNAAKELYFAKNLKYVYQQLANIDTLKSDELCLVPFKINKPIVIENILYEFDSDQLTPASKLVLDELVTLMNDNSNIEIELGAHTDNIGVAIYNLDLSNRRAKSCVDYLASKGIAPERLTSKGYGLTIPVAPNQFQNGKDNPAGRALNRRTEFKVLKK